MKRSIAFAMAAAAILIAVIALHALLSERDEGAEEAGPTLQIVSDGEVKAELDMGKVSKMPYLEGEYAVRSKKEDQTSVYRGVALHHILEVSLGEVPSAPVKFTARDGFSTVVPPEWFQEGNATIIAYMQDGGPLDEGEGPFRLIVPQSLAGEFNGQYCIRDVVRLEVPV